MTELTTTEHDRNFFGEEALVYPVLSRRLNGLSIGVNTRPDIICNFGCLYCEVNRENVESERNPGEGATLDVRRLQDHMHTIISKILAGEIFEGMEIKAITLSGDGEPTMLSNFEEVMHGIHDLKHQMRLEAASTVVITNASQLHLPGVQRGLDTLRAEEDAIWAKLDAGSEEYFRLVAKTKVALSRILANILETSKSKPMTIQTCLMNIQGQAPSDEEIQSLCNRINAIISGGGTIRGVQLYTVSRKPASSAISALDEERLRSIGQTIAKNIPVPVQIYS